MKWFFEERHYTFRYPLVGVATYILESVLFGVLLLVWSQQHYLVSYYAAGVGAVLFNFMGHKLFTFAQQKVLHPLIQLLLDAGLKLLILAGRGWLLTLLVEKLGLPPVSGIGLTALVVAVTFTVTSWVLGGSSPTQTWGVLWGYVKYVWGYATFGWWLTKEYLTSYKHRFR